MKPGWVEPSIVTGSEIVGKAVEGIIVWDPEPGMLKTIPSAPGWALASRIACLSEPGPLSFTLVTTNVDAVGVAEGVGVGVGVPPGVAVGVGVPQPPCVISTVSVTNGGGPPMPPPTTRRRAPIAVPAVKERATFRFGPVDQVLLAIS